MLIEQIDSICVVLFSNQSPAYGSRWHKPYTAHHNPLRTCIQQLFCFPQHPLIVYHRRCHTCLINLPFIDHFHFPSITRNPSIPSSDTSHFNKSHNPVHLSLQTKEPTRYFISRLASFQELTRDHKSPLVLQLIQVPNRNADVQWRIQGDLPGRGLGGRGLPRGHWVGGGYPTPIPSPIVPWN